LAKGGASQKAEYTNNLIVAQQDAMKNFDDSEIDAEELPGGFLDRLEAIIGDSNSSDACSNRYTPPIAHGAENRHSLKNRVLSRSRIVSSIISSQTTTRVFALYYQYRLAIQTPRR
jgi:hypothetical protein